MLVLSLVFAIATAFIPMPRVAHTLITVLIMCGAFLAMGVGGCTQYWDNHMQPGRSTGSGVVFSALLVILARAVAVGLFANASDRDATRRTRRR